jgi:hypothetical protein
MPCVRNTVYVSVGYALFEFELKADVSVLWAVWASFSCQVSCGWVVHLVRATGYGELSVSSIHVSDKRVNCIESVALSRVL